MDPLIIAEIGWNHMGDMALAEKMIVKAKESGCKIAKFQTWNVSRLKDGEWDNDGRREIYNNAELSIEDHYFLKETCLKNSIQFLSSAFSIKDAELLKKINCKSVKIPSFEVSNKIYLYIVKIIFKRFIYQLGPPLSKKY